MRTRLAATAVATLLLASGCAAFSDDAGTVGSDGGQAGSGEGPVVAAAFYPLAWAAEQVGGDRVGVELLTAPGAEPHDLELTVRETAMLAQADLVVLEEGFQPAVDDGVEQNATGEVLDVVDVVDLLAADETESEHAHEEDGEHAGEEDHTDDHADDHAGEDDHAHEEGEDHTDEHTDEHTEEEGEAHAEGEEHDHGEFDPHFWLDPLRMADLGDAMGERLGEIDPDGAEEYTANAEALRAELEQLDTDYTEGLAACERDTIVVSHDAFGYLGKYGLEVEGVAGLTPDAEPTPAGLAELQQLARDEGITTVFSERLASPRLTDALAGDLGIGTAVLDPIEGLTDETSGEDYRSLMEQNLVALREANGCS